MLVIEKNPHESNEEAKIFISNETLFRVSGFAVELPRDRIISTKAHPNWIPDF
jgi:hypothetical protein